MTVLNNTKSILTNAQLMCAGIVAISVMSFGMALIAEHIFGLAPCILCLYQRVPFLITFFLGLFGLISLNHKRSQNRAAFFIFLSGLAFLTGSIIAFYHTGVELHWWASFIEGCKVDVNAALNPDQFLAQIQAAQAVRCDEIPWADPVFGLSMANYNALISLGLALACISSSVLIMRKTNGL